MTTTTPARPTFRGTLLPLLRDIAVVVLLSCLTALLLKTFLIRSFFIPSSSMEGTLEVRDRIVVNELVPKVFPVARGDVIVFRDPGGWVASKEGSAPAAPFRRMLQAAGWAADDTSEHLVKRVIGVGGDRVRCCDTVGRVLVNDNALTEPYISVPRGERRASSVTFDVTVPPGAVWVMGDNRYNSLDSRFHQSEPGNGFVRETEIVGRAFLITWPAARVGWLDDYATSFAQ